MKCKCQLTWRLLYPLTISIYLKYNFEEEKREKKDHWTFALQRLRWPGMLFCAIPSFFSLNIWCSPDVHSNIRISDSNAVSVLQHYFGIDNLKATAVWTPEKKTTGGMHLMAYGRSYFICSFNRIFYIFSKDRIIGFLLSNKAITFIYLEKCAVSNRTLDVMHSCHAIFHLKKWAFVKSISGRNF